MSNEAGIVFVHGLAKKPAPEKLQEIWLWALGRDNPMPTVFAAPNNGINLDNAGARPYFNYYADVFYGEDYETDLASYYESSDGEKEISGEVTDTASNRLSEDDPTTPRERAFLAAFEMRLAAQLEPLSQASDIATSPANHSQLEIAGLLPEPTRRAIIKKTAMEAYYFLFDKVYERADGSQFRVRKELRARLINKLNEARAKAGRLVIVSHSMGTMVAYDVLRNCPDCPMVDTLITIGSPLGVKEVQDELRSPDSSLDFPASRLSKWINIYDPLDPICGADPKFANDYAAVDGKSVRDIKESNWGKWRHTATHYLAGIEFRKQLLQSLE
jgi:hypothetical protein